VKTGVPTVDAPHAEAPASAARAADWVTLTKPRLNLLVLITTLAGLYLAEPSGVSTSLLVHTLLSLHSAAVVQITGSALLHVPPVHRSVVDAFPSLQSALVTQQPALGL